MSTSSNSPVGKKIVPEGETGEGSYLWTVGSYSQHGAESGRKRWFFLPLQRPTKTLAGRERNS